MDDFETDEDRMIYQLKLHRDLVSWICDQLSEKNIEYKITRGNSPEGDILLLSQNDAPTVKNLIKGWQSSYN